jgi:hypothetical protein
VLPAVLQVLDRNVENLSGGELQRFAIAVVAAQKADVYMIDEPSSYLDVRQRLKAAKVSSSCQWGWWSGWSGGGRHTVPMKQLRLFILPSGLVCDAQQSPLQIGRLNPSWGGKSHISRWRPRGAWSCKQAVQSTLVIQASNGAVFC